VAPYILRADGSIHQGSSRRADPGLLTCLNGRDLTLISVNYQASLHVDDYAVMLGTKFVLHAPNAQTTHILDPEVRADLGPLLALFPDAVVNAGANSDASLRLVFASGAVLTVEADPQYEAWQVSGPDGFLVVCPPIGDGTLAVWETEAL
jgi:hypothetical protein